EPETMAGRGSSGPAGALVRGGAANFLDEQSVNAAASVEPSDSGEAAVDDDLDSVDRKRRLRHVGRDDCPAFMIRSERGVLLCWRELAVERQRDELIAHPRCPDGRDSAADFIFSGHENKDITHGIWGQALELVSGQLPVRIAVAADGSGQVFNLNRKRAAARAQD